MTKRAKNFARASVKASALIHAALKSINNEIDRHNQGSGQVGNIYLLTDMKESLQDMLDEIKTFKPGNIEKKCVGRGRIIVDSWSLGELGESILGAEQAYFDI